MQLKSARRAGLSVWQCMAGTPHMLWPNAHPPWMATHHAHATAPLAAPRQPRSCRHTSPPGMSHTTLGCGRRGPIARYGLMHHDGGRFQRGAPPSPLCHSGTPSRTDARGACWVCGTPATMRRSPRHAAARPAAGARRAAAVRRRRSQPAGRALSIAGVACGAAPCVVCVRRRARLWVWRRQGGCCGGAQWCDSATHLDGGDGCGPHTADRAALGIEPRTSCTLSKNHATRPSSQARLQGSLPYGGASGPSHTAARDSKQ